MRGALHDPADPDKRLAAAPLRKREARVHRNRDTFGTTFPADVRDRHGNIGKRPCKPVCPVNVNVQRPVACNVCQLQERLGLERFVQQGD